MQWKTIPTPTWNGTISNEDAKREIAVDLARRANDGEVIGIGSGSTSYLALLALADRVNQEGLRVRCVPTSLEIEQTCTALGLDITSLVNSRPDWCFDGADEVDPDQNLIKGRGGAFVREKLVFAAAQKRYILVDDSKFVDQLGQKFPVPLAVVPEASSFVRDELTATTGSTPVVRPAGGKDGGVIDEHASLVMDLPYPAGFKPAELDSLLLGTPGISATGLFVGFDLELIR